MLYLLLAIVTSAMISTAMRLSEEKITCNIAMLAMGYITSSALAVLTMGPANLLPAHPELPTAIAMGAINGLLYMLGLVLMQWNVSRNGVVLTSTFTKLGLIVCMALSVVLFREIPSAVQLIGFFLAIGAIVLNGSGRRRQASLSRVGLLLTLVVGGISDTWVKVYGVYGTEGLSDQFLLMTFVTAAVLCLGLMVLKKQRIGLWEVVFGAAVAVPNYYNSRFLLKSLQTLPGIIVYPTFSVSALLLVSVVGVCMFKEKLSRLQWISMGMILIALALLNL